MVVQDRPVLGPAALVTATAVARRFYLDGKSKVEIAQELGLSRFKVARVLEQARAAGLVSIEIKRTSEINPELSETVRAAFGLRHAIVVDTHDEDDQPLRRLVGRTAAALLGDLVTEGDVLGVAWGRSLREMTAQLGTLPACTVVQLCGALSRPDMDENSVELTRNAARLSGGTAVTFYAPLVVSDPATATALRQQADVQAASRHYDNLDVAVVAVGAWAPNQSTVYDALSAREQRALASGGACAEVSGHVLDAAGIPIADGLTERTVNVSVRQLCAAREVVGLVYGAAKARAARAVLTGGLVTSLVTHSSLAHALLEDAG
jgi:DNA-binding transcriptional regulator LsrR (DeoR family)